VLAGVDLPAVASPENHPRAGQLPPISEVFERLQSLVGETNPDIGYNQERNRVVALHRKA